MRNILISIFFVCSGFVVPAMAPSFASGMLVHSPSEVDECANLYESMQLEGVVNYKAFRQAVEGYRKIENRHRDILTLIDFSKPSTEKRLYVFDMKTAKCFSILLYRMAETAVRTMPHHSQTNMVLINALWDSILLRLPITEVTGIRLSLMDWKRG